MKIEGRDRLLRRMRQIAPAARRDLRKVLDTSSAELEGAVKRFAPVSSGALRKSIGRTFGTFQPANANVRGVGAGNASQADPDLSVTVHAGDEVAWYAALVESGTRPHDQPNNPRVGFEHPGASAQPYFFPAYRLLRGRIRRRLAAANTKAIKSLSGSGR